MSMGSDMSSTCHEAIGEALRNLGCIASGAAIKRYILSKYRTNGENRRLGAIYMAAQLTNSKHISIILPCQNFNEMTVDTNFTTKKLMDLMFGRKN